MAFSTRAAAGGAGGMIIAQALRYGVARGVFSNEAGLGSAPIAAAAATVCAVGMAAVTVVVCKRLFEKNYFQVSDNIFKAK